MNKKYLLGLCLITFFLNACSSFKELTIEQIKTQEYFRASGQIKADILEIEKVFLSDLPYRRSFIYDHIPVNIRTNTKKTVAEIYWVTGGLTKNHTFSLVEFVKDDNTGQTNYKIYSDIGLFGKRDAFAQDFVKSFKKKPYKLKKYRIVNWRGR